MKWNHGHSLFTGILFGIVISQRAILLIIIGAVLFFILSKFGAIMGAVTRRINGRARIVTYDPRKPW